MTSNSQPVRRSHARPAELRPEYIKDGWYLLRGAAARRSQFAMSTGHRVAACVGEPGTMQSTLRIAERGAKLRRRRPSIVPSLYAGLMLTSVLDGLFGERVGSIPSSVLALHGWGRTRADMRPVLAGMDALAVDLPGFGASPTPVVGWGSADYARQIEPLLARLSGRRRAGLAGTETAQDMRPAPVGVP